MANNESTILSRNVNKDYVASEVVATVKTSTVGALELANMAFPQDIDGLVAYQGEDSVMVGFIDYEVNNLRAFIHFNVEDVLYIDKLIGDLYDSEEIERQYDDGNIVAPLPTIVNLIGAYISYELDELEGVE